MNTRAQGMRWEREAEKFLCGQGAEVLERNYSRGGGEIDLIVRFGDILAFVEVKQRTTARYGTPGEAVGKRKQARICRAALYYLQEHRLMNEHIRFDVVEIMASDIRHIAGAFDFTE